MRPPESHGLCLHIARRGFEYVHLSFSTLPIMKISRVISAALMIKAEQQQRARDVPEISISAGHTSVFQ